MRGYSKDTLIFMAIAGLLMWTADYWLFGGKEAIDAIHKQKAAAPAIQIIEHPETAPTLAPAPVIIAPPEPQPVVSEDYNEYDDFDFFNDEEWYGYQPGPDAVITVPPLPPVSSAPPSGVRPRIAIIIDDVGMNGPLSHEALALPAPVTMAILPYAAQAAQFAARAQEKGHEILIHTPMEAMSAPVSLGGMGLTTDMDEAAITAMMDRITGTFSGFIGINNHMGSKFTADRAAMERLMPYLKKRGLMFIDSKTIGNSVAGTVAMEQGVPTAARDIFLDHEETPHFVASALTQLERRARRNGYAIAIGHPKNVTLQGLRAWLPTLESKGIDLVPLSTLVSRPENDSLVTVSAPVSSGPATTPDLRPTEQPLLYSPSPEIRF